MTRHLRLGEFLLGVEGIALARQLFLDDDAVAQRLEEIREIACGEKDVYDLGVDVPVVEPREGYARWATTYDDPGNPLISVEEPVVRSIVADLEPGVALDAACGTGRHARHLADAGHRVIGVDASVEMLDRARAAVPSAAFREGELTSLPLDAETVDLAICALALEHVAGLDKAIAELARVLRPGGRAIISELHPVVRALGGCAYFQDARGAAGIVRGHSHLHGDYLRAFDAARLTVRACHEPRFGRDEAAMQGPAAQFVPAAADAAYVGLPGALIWDLERGDGARS